MAEIRISNFSSLHFQRPEYDPNPLPLDGWQLGMQQHEGYAIKYLPGDPIRVQYTTYDDSGNVLLYLVNFDTGENIPLSPTLIYTSDDGTIKSHDLLIANLDLGSYAVVVYHNNPESDPLLVAYFCIVEELPYSLLLEYTNYRNEFDTIFDGLEFCLRLEASFLPSEVAQNVENNTFRSQRNRLIQLSALPFESHTLTVGGDYGVPNWVARKLNLLFSTTTVTINNIPYVRGENSAPDINPLHSGVALFIYKISLEPYDNYSTRLSLTGAYLLSSEDDRLITTEDGDYFIDMSFFIWES